MYQSGEWSYRTAHMYLMQKAYRRMTEILVVVARAIRHVNSPVRHAHPREADGSRVGS